jgi:hypothetical protein
LRLIARKMFDHHAVRKVGVLSVSLLCALNGSLLAQLRVSGQASAAFVASQSGVSQYVFNQGRSTFAWRLDLFGDAVISDNVAFLSNFRILQDQVLHIDYLVLRLTDIASSGINAELGQISIPFGNLGEHRFPWRNPFFSLSLMNEHRTSLSDHDYNLRAPDPARAASGDGVHLLDGALYDLGVQLYGNIGVFTYSAAIINGMISGTGTYGSAGLNTHHGFGKILRLAATPQTGLTIGVSYAFGPYMKDVYGKDATHYPQRIVGSDVEFSTGYFSFYGQAAYNVWEYYSLNLKAFAYSVEGRYALTPRISVACRSGGLLFNSITAQVHTDTEDPTSLTSYSGKWDYDVFRLEGALLYRFARELLFKLTYQWNKTLDVPSDPADNVFALQAVMSF